MVVTIIIIIKTGLQLLVKEIRKQEGCIERSGGWGVDEKESVLLNGCVRQPHTGGNTHIKKRGMVGWTDKPRRG